MANDCRSFVQTFVAQWERAVRDDSPISGADAVDWIARQLPAAREALRGEPRVFPLQGPYRVLCHFDGTDEIYNLSHVKADTFGELLDTLCEQYELAPSEVMGCIMVADVSNHTEAEVATMLSLHNDAHSVVIPEAQFVPVAPDLTKHW